MLTEDLRKNERIDDLQRDGCRIIQRPDLFCFGMDAVLLASWARVKDGDRVLDLCCGNGVVPILMDARLEKKEKKVHFTGVEINSISVDMARRSVLMNHQEERIRILEGDIREICGLPEKEKNKGTAVSAGAGQRSVFVKEQNTKTAASAGAGQRSVFVKEQNTKTVASLNAGQRSVFVKEQNTKTVASLNAGQRCSSGKDQNMEQGNRASGPQTGPERIRPASFDVVTVNPPYMTGGGGLTGENADRIIARHEVLCTADDVARCAGAALRFGGHLYMVHRPHRLPDLFQALSAHALAVKRLRMVHPFSDREANMVLIDAAKGGQPYVHVESPLIVYREKGVYTEEVRELYG